MKSSLLFASIFGLAFAVFLTGCRTAGEVTSSDKPSYVIVLCDVSGTISRIGQRGHSTNSLGEVIRYCSGMILDQKEEHLYKNESTLMFMPIRENMYAQPIEEITLKSVSKAGRKKEEKRRKAAAKKIEDSLKVLANSDYQNTCILTSIGRAYEIFARKPSEHKDKYRYELVILSDMLEECPSAPAGNLDIRKKLGQSIKLLDNFNPDIDISSNGIDVRIKVTSHNITGKANDDLMAFWGKAFKKMGYAKRINFAGEI